MNDIIDIDSSGVFREGNGKCMGAKNMFPPFS
jgi:hypothetical protein